MDVTDTKPLEKCCSKCSEIKTENMFIPNRNICKECRNKNSREKYKALDLNENVEKECNTCKSQQPISSFIKNRQICKDCNNSKRRSKYENDENHRNIVIQKSNDFKKKRILERNKKKEIEPFVDIRLIRMFRIRIGVWYDKDYENPIEEIWDSIESYKPKLDNTKINTFYLF
jgi:hypothetical protein